MSTWLRLFTAATLLAIASGAFATESARDRINIRNVEAFYDAALNAKDFDRARTYIGDHYTQHNPTAHDGIEGLKAFIGFLRAKFPASHSEIKQAFADGHYGFCTCTPCFGSRRRRLWFERRRASCASKLRPSEIFGGNIMITTSGVEHGPTLRYAIEVLGTDRIMWAIDYPYEEMGPAATFMSEVRISESDRAKISHENAERVFHIGPA